MTQIDMINYDDSVLAPWINGDIKTLKERHSRTEEPFETINIDADILILRWAIEQCAIHNSLPMFEFLMTASKDIRFHYRAVVLESLSHRAFDILNALYDRYYLNFVHPSSLTSGVSQEDICFCIKNTLLDKPFKILISIHNKEKLQHQLLSIIADLPDWFTYKSDTAKVIMQQDANMTLDDWLLYAKGQPPQFSRLILSTIK